MQSTVVASLLHIVCTSFKASTHSVLIQGIVGCVLIYHQVCPYLVWLHVSILLIGCTYHILIINLRL